MPQPAALLLKLPLLAGAHVEIFDLTQLKFQEIFPLEARTLAVAELLDFTPEAEERLHLARYRNRLIFQLTESIEVLPMRGRVGQCDALMLGGDVAKFGSKFGKLGGGRDPTVQERPGASGSVRLNDAANHEFAHPREVPRFELRGESRPREHLKKRFNFGFFRASAHEFRIRAGPEDEGKSVDNHRLPRPRLAGEHMKTGPELDDELIDQDDISDRELNKHSERPSGFQGLPATVPISKRCQIPRASGATAFLRRRQPCTWSVFKPTAIDFRKESFGFDMRSEELRGEA